MKTILVPTDFSKAADNAAEYAVNLAKAINAKVMLFHVYHMPVSVASETMVFDMNLDDLQKAKEEHLNTQSENLRSKSGVTVNYKAMMGLAVDDILHESKDAYILVMGMRGADLVSEVLVGSITTDIIKKSKVPVLAIPDGVAFKKAERIAFACDYNPQTDLHALNALKSFAKTFNATIDIVNVKKNDEMVTMEEAIAGVKVEDKLEGVAHMYHFPQNDNKVDGINNFVKEHHSDMVAIIPHHYTMLENLFHTSVTKKMAFHTDVPMLTLPDNHKTVAAYFL